MSGGHLKQKATSATANGQGKVKSIQKTKAAETARPLRQKEKSAPKSQRGLACPMRIAAKRYGCGRTALAVLIIVACIVLAYMFVIPRTEATLSTTFYAGALNSMYAETVIKNDGTMDMRDIRAELAIHHGNESAPVASSSQNFTATKRGSQESLDTRFIGNQNDDYRITLNISFKCGSRAFTQSYTFNVRGSGPMYQKFNEKITAIGS